MSCLCVFSYSLLEKKKQITSLSLGLGSDHIFFPFPALFEDFGVAGAEALELRPNNGNGNANGPLGTPRHFMSDVADMGASGSVPVVDMGAASDGWSDIGWDATA